MAKRKAPKRRLIPTISVVAAWLVPRLLGIASAIAVKVIVEVAVQALLNQSSVAVLGPSVLLV